MRTIAGVCHYALSLTAQDGVRRPRYAAAAARITHCGVQPAPAACRAARRCATLWERREEAPAGAWSQRKAPDQRRAIGSAGERLVHTEEVTGSIPVSPTRSEAM